MLTWKESLSVGVPKIDSQHKELIAKLNDFMNACGSSNGAERVSSMLSFLKKYTKEHFKDEEEIMLKNNYPGYKDQKRAHESFVKKIEDIENQLSKGTGSLNLVLQTNKALSEWLVNHISKMDKNLGDFLKLKEDK